MIENPGKYVAVICVFYLCISVSTPTEYVYYPDVDGNQDAPEARIDSVARLAERESAKDPSGSLGSVADAGGGKGGDGANPPVAISLPNSGQPLALKARMNDGLEFSSNPRMSVKMQYFIIAIVCAVVAVTGVVIALACYCKFRRNESTSFAGQGQINGYATYGVTGPTTKNGFQFHEPGDRKLAQSAQMYHYQYQKQQMIDMEKANGEVKPDATDEENEAEDEDDVVYQTCGLATSDDLQIPNPMFKGEDGSKQATDDDRQTDDTHPDGKVGRKG